MVYVLFGSGATLSHEQMIELAWGLEMSKQRFVWVVRAPTEESGDKAYLNGIMGGVVIKVMTYLGTYQKGSCQGSKMLDL